MCKSFKYVHEVTPIPHDVIKRQVHDGLSTKFWLDSWLDGETLATQFPRLLSLEVDQNCLVYDRIASVNRNWNWRRGIRSCREQEHLDLMLKFIGEFKLSTGNDVWSWNYRGGENFQVSNLRHALDTFLLPADNFSTPWNPWLPKKINIFTWRLFRDRLPSRINLALRRVPNISLTCPICFSDLDLIEHTFNTCRVASDWRTLLSRWLQLSIPDYNPIDIRNWMDSVHGSASYKQILLGIFSSWWWILWKNKNQAAFQLDYDTNNTLFLSTVTPFFLWLSSRCNKFLYRGLHGKLLLLC
uniref:uncharacterized protein LOC122587518 n=1 Tax=Erigeron canadensis TaxID=72917 RepID=UPI001CB95214|nr:uncharacterized protein LOC122587518 [Erigeron canadensis]